MMASERQYGALENSYTNGSRGYGALESFYTNGSRGRYAGSFGDNSSIEQDVERDCNSHAWISVVETNNNNNSMTQKQKNRQLLVTFIAALKPLIGVSATSGVAVRVQDTVARALMFGRMAAKAIVMRNEPELEGVELDGTDLSGIHALTDLRMVGSAISATLDQLKYIKRAEAPNATVSNIDNVISELEVAFEFCTDDTLNGSRFANADESMINDDEFLAGGKE